MANGQSDEAAGQEQGSNGGNGKGSAVSNATSSTGRMITSGLRVLQVLLAISCIILLGVADSENARANVPVFQFVRSSALFPLPFSCASCSIRTNPLNCACRIEAIVRTPSLALALLSYPFPRSAALFGLHPLALTHPSAHVHVTPHTRRHQSRAFPLPFPLRQSNWQFVTPHRCMHARKQPEYSMAVAVVSFVFVSVALVLGVLNKTPSFMSLMDLIIALLSVSAGSTLLADYEPIRSTLASTITQSTTSVP